MKVYLRKNDHDPDMIELFSRSTNYNKKYLWAVIHIDMFYDTKDNKEIFDFLKEHDEAECELSVIIK